jgi:transposase InsO family protein
LNRNFTVAAPNQAWTGDITYIPTDEGWLFLAVVIDLFSRRVVGWSMQTEMRSSLVIDALEMAWYQRRPDLTAGLIFHSDRGSQYASLDFCAVLKGHGIGASMSRKGNCQDNAPAETLFGSRTVERLQGERFHLPSGQGRSPSLAALVEPRTHALNAELCESSRVRKRPKGCSDEDGRIKSAAAEAGGGNAPTASTATTRRINSSKPAR